MTRDEFRNAFRALLEDAVNAGLEAKDVRSVIEEDVGAHDAAEIERLLAAGAELIKSAELSDGGRLAMVPIGIYGKFYGAYINDPDGSPEQSDRDYCERCCTSHKSIHCPPEQEQPK
jgi:hypothetical protein